MAKKAPAQSDEVRVNPLIAVSFFFLVFSLFFEDAAPGRVEPSTLAGFLFLGSTLLQPKLCFKKPSPALIFFGIFAFIAVLGVILMADKYPREASKRAFQFTYLVTMCWVMVNIMSVSKIFRLGLVAMASASFTLALLQLSGVAAQSWGRGVGDRVTAFGFHPNQLALNFALGVMVLMGLAASPEGKKYLPNYVLWPLVGIIVAAIVQTGSRGGLLALAVGMLVLCFQPGNARQRASAITMTIVGAIMVTLLVMNSPSTLARINATVNEGNVSRRDLVYPIAIDLFQERPIFGWGVSENVHELGQRFQEPGTPSKDTHNILLYALTATGVVGTIPLLLGIWFSFLSAWRSRMARFGITPFALIVTTMAAAAGLTLFQTKIFWTVIAIAIASSYYISKTRSPAEVRAV